jgi:hypothetical protein
MRMKRSITTAAIVAALLVTTTTPAFAVASPQTHGRVSAADRAKVIRQIRRAWGGNDNKAIRVAECESGLNPKATSPGGTYLGLWQFSRATWNDYDGPGNDPRDVNAYRQTQVAYRLFQDRRWAPWPTCGRA